MHWDSLYDTMILCQIKYEMSLASQQLRLQYQQGHKEQGNRHLTDHYNH